MKSENWHRQTAHELFATSHLTGAFLVCAPPKDPIIESIPGLEGVDPTLIAAANDPENLVGGGAPCPECDFVQCKCIDVQAQKQVEQLNLDPGESLKDQVMNLIKEGQGNDAVAKLSQALQGADDSNINAIIDVAYDALSELDSAYDANDLMHTLSNYGVDITNMQSALLSNPNLGVSLHGASIMAVHSSANDAVAAANVSAPSMGMSGAAGSGGGFGGGPGGGGPGGGLG